MCILYLYLVLVYIYPEIFFLPFPGACRERRPRRHDESSKSILCKYRLVFIFAVYGGARQPPAGFFMIVRTPIVRGMCERSFFPVCFRVSRICMYNIHVQIRANTSSLGVL